jgi:hypothetical protein
MILNPLTLCTLSGFVEDVAGDPIPNALVRVRILYGVAAVVGNVALSAAPMFVYTDDAGAFAFDLPQGALARIEIPESGLDASFHVPQLLAATFANVTLREYDAS